MKSMLITLIFLVGCSRTTEIEVRRPEGQWNTAATEGVFDATAAHTEQKPSRFQLCMNELAGAQNAITICNERMEAHKPRRINWYRWY